MTNSAGTSPRTTVRRAGRRGIGRSAAFVSFLALPVVASLAPAEPIGVIGLGALTAPIEDVVDDSAVIGVGRIDAARDLGANGKGWTTGEVADHPAVEIGERQVRDHLHRLARRGYVAVETAGTGFVWRDDGLHRVGEHGEVELGAGDVGEPDDAESAELARNILSVVSRYTLTTQEDNTRHE